MSTRIPTTEFGDRRRQLAQLYDRFTTAKIQRTRNRIAWKLVKLILNPSVPFASVTLTSMPRKNYTWYECTVIELFRLGYGFDKEPDAPSIDSDDAYYLLYVMGGDEPLDPLLYAGVVWAAKNRHVNWAYQLSCAQLEGWSDRLDRLMADANLLHLKKDLIVENGNVKDPAWAQVSDVEKRAIDERLSAKVASMTEAECEARWSELRDAPESYENIMESMMILLGCTPRSSET